MLNEGDILLLFADALPTIATVVLIMVPIIGLGYWVWKTWFR